MKKAESAKDSKNQRIQVFARCRPINSYEKKQYSPNIVEVNTERKEVKVCDHKMVNKCFAFDKVFGPETKQVAVYKAVVAPLINEVLMGYNCTVFAYGQTGTGKTYTMEGERSNVSCSWEEDPNAGIIPRSLHQLFEELTKGEENMEFSVHVSFLELYNEELFDLLSQNDLSKLRLFEDSTRKGSVVIQGLEEIKVNSKDEVYSILEQGTSRRQTASTLLNASSSRSHTVFSVTVHIKENTIDGEELLKTGKLNLVDLAGSENIGRSGASMKTAREAGNINQSLLTLGRVITALVEKAPHIPYRESKLTRLLQDSLGGHTKTSIIATVSPAQCNIEETISTLDYAYRAKNITIKPEINQKMTKKTLIKQYTEEIERLRKDLAANRDKTGFYVDLDNYNSMVEKISSADNKVTDLESQLENLLAEREKIEALIAIKEAKLKELEQELDLTKTQFTKTTQKLNKTQRKLQTAKTELVKSVSENCEQKYIVEVQNKREMERFHEEQILLNVAEDSVCDVDGLHNKIDRKQRVEDVNKKSLSGFRAEVQKEFIQLEECVSSLISQNSHTLDSLGSDMEMVTKACNLQAESSQSLLTKLVEPIITGFDSQLNVREAEMNTFLQSCVGYNETFVSLMQDNILKQQKFIEIILALVNSMRKKLSIQDAEAQSYKEVVLSKLQKVKQATEQVNAFQKPKIEDVINMQELNVNHHQDRVENIKSFVSKRANNMKLAKNDQEECIKKFEKHQISEIKKFCSELIKRSNCEDEESAIMDSEILKNAEEITVADKNSSSMMNSNLRESLESMDAHRLKEISILSELEEEHIECSTKGQENRNIAANDCDSIKKVVSEFETERETERKEISDMFENVLSVEKEKAAQNFDKYQKHIETQKAELTLSASNIQEKQAQHVETILNIAKSHDQLGKAEKKNLKECEEKIKLDLLHKDTLVEKFISEVYVQDIPTGTTPLRKTYEFPKRLLPVMSPGTILRSYKELNDIGHALDEPLESSFDDVQPEEKTTTKPEIVEPLEEDFVLSSEESCHESDSSISSYKSVSSYKSGKNKENRPVNQIISSIPRIVGEKKRKKFIKPKALAPQKPLLYSSNECLNSKE